MEWIGVYFFIIETVKLCIYSIHTLCTPEFFVDIHWSGVIKETVQCTLKMFVD